MTIGQYHVYGGTCTLHGAYAEMHCPTCVTVLTPPPTATNVVVYPALINGWTNATAPTGPTVE